MEGFPYSGVIESLIPVIAVKNVNSVHVLRKNVAEKPSSRHLEKDAFGWGEMIVVVNQQYSLSLRSASGPIEG